MKKIILLIILCLFNVGVIKALDMPNFGKVAAVVTNENGITVKDSNGKTIKKLAYNSEIEVGMLNDKLYYGTYEIDINDIKIIEKNFDNSNYNNLNKNKQVKVLNKEGTNLYYGPSNLYESVIHVPENTILNVTDYDIYKDTHAYSEYENTKGWLYTYNFLNEDNYIATIKNGKVYTLESSVEVYEFPNKSEHYKVIEGVKDIEYTYSMTISKEENIIWYYVDELEGWIYTNINNNDLSLQTLLISNDEKSINALFIKANKDIPIYKTLSDASTYETFIPNNTALFGYYKYYDNQDTYYYIEYDNIYGWIRESDCNDILISETKYTYMYYGDSDLTLYADAYAGSKINKLTKYNIIDGYMFSYKYNNMNTLQYYLYKDGEWEWSDKLYSDIVKPSLAIYDKNGIETLKLINDTYIYKGNTQYSEKLGNIKSDNEFSVLCQINDTWYYIKYNDIVGWVRLAKVKQNKEYVYKSLDEVSSMEDDGTNNSNDEKTLETEKQEKIEDKNKSINIAKYIFFIIIIFLGTYIFMNYKKKSINKETNNSEEEKK